MIRGLVIREAESKDHLAIAKLVEAAFGRPAEARLVEKLREDGDMVLELVATNFKLPGPRSRHVRTDDYTVGVLDVGSVVLFDQVLHLIEVNHGASRRRR